MEEKEIIRGNNIFKKTIGRILKITSIITIVLIIIVIISNNTGDKYLNKLLKARNDRYDLDLSLKEKEELDEKIDKLDSLCDFWNDTFYFSGYSAIGFSAVTIVLFIFKFYASKMEVVVTNKRVYGIARFGRRIDLPIDSISSVGTGFLKGINIGTSSGRIFFRLMKNNQEIHSKISKLLNNRQNDRQETNSSAPDELKKYKELLDNGTINQEEFEAKKKQLLNL